MSGQSQYNVGSSIFGLLHQKLTISHKIKPGLQVATSVVFLPLSKDTHVRLIGLSGEVSQV